MSFLFAAELVGAQSWPQVPIPKEVRAFDIGQQITINGLPMRMQGFVSSMNPARMADLFRQAWGEPIVEDNIGNKRVLGRAQGEFYMSVQIESAGLGSRGVVSVSHIKAAYDNRSETKEAADLWLMRLPPGSRVISHTTSEDAGRVSNHLVVVNNFSESVNRDRLKDLMSEDGFDLERESKPDERAVAARPTELGASMTLFFKGAGKEAMATIGRNDRGMTTTVLNTVIRMKYLK